MCLSTSFVSASTIHKTHGTAKRNFWSSPGLIIVFDRNSSPEGNRKMLGFTIPLLVFAGFQGTMAILLLMPLPIARPAIWVCKQAETQIGRTVLTTISTFLVILVLAPLYDLVSLHKIRYESKGTDVNNPEAREAEATSNLSAILTISCLVTTYVIKRLGLALAEIDARGGWSDASKPATEIKEVKNQ